jgi:hypothetical protein
MRYDRTSNVEIILEVGNVLQFSLKLVCRSFRSHFTGTSTGAADDMYVVGPS